MIITIGGQDFTVNYTENPEAVKAAFGSDPGPIATYDVESTGLHLKKDRPFVHGLCWNRQVWLMPTNKETLPLLHYLSDRVRTLYAHNTTFDMHMAANIMEDDEFIMKIQNWGDTMGLCRLIFDAVSARDGGDRLALKVVMTKYIDKDADRFEKAVKAWLAAKVKADRQILIAMLKAHKWGITRFEDAMNKGKEPIPDEIMATFHQWRNAYPEPTYKDVPDEIMHPYLAVDVIGTLLLAEKAEPVVTYKEQDHTRKMEFELLPYVFEMERQGIPVDRDYLMESDEKLTLYIDTLQKEMWELGGEVFSSGQHAVIKRILETKHNRKLPSSDKSVLKKLIAEGCRLSRVIMKLRTLEKWKSTYVDRILDVSEYDGKFYSSMNQFNPVSGRFSGDAQQFPKDKLMTIDGDDKKDKGEDFEDEVLFWPRRAFKMRGYYLDFSQVELRVQGHYTMYYGGDINLCRAYMPFQCVHYETGEYYNPHSIESRARWNEMKPGAPFNTVHWEDLLKDGWSVWVVPDTREPWKPTDVHSQTTWRALRIMGFVPEEMPAKELKWWRNKGKTFNFMRNYGGGNAKAAETLDIEFDQAVAMNNGYTDAFPLVVTYQKGVEQSMRKNGYAVNMSGRRYYVSSSSRHYKVANYLIQGTSADDLKKKMIKIAKWLRKQGLKTRMVLCVHDELQFTVPVGEDWCIPVIQRMMEDTPEILVPIVAEVEFTETYWSDKKKVLDLDAERFQRPAA